MFTLVFFAGVFELYGDEDELEVGEEGGVEPVVAGGGLAVVLHAVEDAFDHVPSLVRLPVVAPWVRAVPLGWHDRRQAERFGQQAGGIPLVDAVHEQLRAHERAGRGHRAAPVGRVVPVARAQMDPDERRLAVGYHADFGVPASPGYADGLRRKRPVPVAERVEPSRVDVTVPARRHKVDPRGCVTQNGIAGGRRTVNVGRENAGRTVELEVVHGIVTVTGEILAEQTLDTTRDYQYRKPIPGVSDAPGHM